MCHAHGVVWSSPLRTTDKSPCSHYALAGVAAGRAGRFGYVVGVDRFGRPDALLAHGADIVVENLVELLEWS